VEKGSGEVEILEILLPVFGGIVGGTRVWWNRKISMYHLEGRYEQGKSIF